VDLEAAYQSVQEVVAETEEKRLARSRDVRSLLVDLVATLEAKAMTDLNQAREDYFRGDHAQALSRFEEITAFNGLRAAREAAGELRKEADRSEWRTLHEAASAQLTDADFVSAQPTLRDLTQLARRTGYGDDTDAIIERFGAVAQDHIDRAGLAIEADDYDAAYGVLIEISRLAALREQAILARQLLRESASHPGMRQAQREYEAAEMLAEARQSLVEAEGRRDVAAARHQVRRQLERIETQYDGTKAAEQACQIRDGLEQ